MPPTRRPAQVPPEGAPDPAADAGNGAVRILKKYPNRRLYDTRRSSYITLADVKRMVLGGEHFEVRDAKTAEDLTRNILLQIILEEESGGVPMFSTQTLEQMIRFYGHATQGLMGQVLEQNMQALVDMQKRLLVGSTAPFGQPAMSPELWTQFVSGQAPMFQGLMGSYAEQSRRMFEQLLSSGLPGFTPPKR